MRDDLIAVRAFVHLIAELGAHLRRSTTRTFGERFVRARSTGAAHFLPHLPFDIVHRRCDAGRILDVLRIERRRREGDRQDQRRAADRRFGR